MDSSTTIKAALTVKVGLTYQRRDGVEVTISRVEQHGISQHNLLASDGDYYTITGDSLFGEKHDLIKHVPKGLPVSGEQVKVGECITYMDDRVPSNGAFKDWLVSSLFTISPNMFSAMNASLGRAGMLIQNRAAYLVSASWDYHGDIIDVLVIFRYDESYVCATLHAPHHSIS